MFQKDLTLQRLGQHLWNKRISLYLDVVGFEFKTCLQDQFKDPKTRKWKKNVKD